MPSSCMRLSAAGTGYAAAEASNVSLLVKGLQQQFFDQGFFSPFIYLTGQPLFGKAAVGPVVTGTTGPGLGGRLLTDFFNGSLGNGSGGVSPGTGTPQRGDRGPGGDLLPGTFRSVRMATMRRRAGTSRRRQTVRWMPAVSSICSTASWERAAGTAIWPSPGGGHRQHRGRPHRVVVSVAGRRLAERHADAAGRRLVVLGQRDGAEHQREPGRLPRHAAAKFRADRTLGRRRLRHARRRRLHRRPRGEHRQQPPSRCGDVRRGRK